jgi:hypothetical protein
MPRPNGHFVQHDGERDDDSLENICWLLRNDNNKKENLDPKLDHSVLVLVLFHHVTFYFPAFCIHIQSGQRS